MKRSLLIVDDDARVRTSLLSALEDADTNVHAEIEVERAQRFDELDAGQLRAEARITSYNVCYTKLLRTPSRHGQGRSRRCSGEEQGSLGVRSVSNAVPDGRCWR